MAGMGVAGRLRTAGRTLGMLALLQTALPVDLALTSAALLRSLLVPPTREVAAIPRTILVSGGKMTKALALARAFHRAGHRVVLVESTKYRLTGHRFSRAVAAFHTVPPPAEPGYAEALLAVVLREGVDVYVPVCSPAASVHDAAAAEVLAGHCEVLHVDEGTVRMLDDKFAFSRVAAELGLGVPECHRITDPQQVVDFDFTSSGRPFVLKSLAYDPVRRMDLTPLPRPTRAETAAFVRDLPISETNPWILQAFVTGQEYCTHSTVREGRVQVYGCCESSAFQINYAMTDQPEIRAWVERFVGELKLTGQVSFDFIQDADGRVEAIECNPRTHSAITMFHDHPGLAAAYLEDRETSLEPRPASRATYWIYHEVWRLLTRPGDARHRLGVILRGQDAIFAWDDPLPFLAVHHLQIPALLLDSLRHGRGWTRVDLNIGKLVEPAGD